VAITAIVAGRPRYPLVVERGSRRRHSTIGERACLVSTKRQQTMAKAARERAVKEKRLRKLEKRRAAAAEREAATSPAAEATPEPEA